MRVLLPEPKVLAPDTSHTPPLSLLNVVLASATSPMIVPVLLIVMVPPLSEMARPEAEDEAGAIVPALVRVAAPLTVAISTTGFADVPSPDALPSLVIVAVPPLPPVACAKRAMPVVDVDGPEIVDAGVAAVIWQKLRYRTRPASMVDGRFSGDRGTAGTIVVRANSVRSGRRCD